MNYRLSCGESFADVHLRVIPVFEQIVQANYEGNALIVGHAGINRVILCHILSIPLSHLFRLGQNYGSLSIIAYEKGQMRLIAMNIPVSHKDVRLIGKEKGTSDFGDNEYLLKEK